ncbi:MAG: CehA/McbA family metallohydrolase [Bacillota bacterium]
MSSRLGEATIWPEDDVTVDTIGTWEITCTVGETGIPQFGGFRVYVPPGWSVPQLDHPNGQGYVRYVVESAGEVELEPYLYSGRWIGLEVKRGKLTRGDRVKLIYGDKSRGGLGALAPRVPVPCNEFTVSLDVEGYYNYVKLPKSPSLKVIPGPARAVCVVVPSLVKAGQEFDVHLNVVDDRQNPTMSSGPCLVQLEAVPEGACALTHRVSCSRGLASTKVALSKEGTFFIEAKVNGTSLAGTSNPVRVLADTPGLKLYWGDIHGHSSCSDGRFSPEEYYRYARDVSRLDFCSLTDHDTTGSNSNVEEHSKRMCMDTWDHIKKVTNDFNEPNRFTTLVGYEYTQTEIEVGGHRNVYFASDDPPVFCCWDEKANTPTKLFEALRESNERAIVIPHHPLRFMSREHDPLVQRLFEIYSMWGSSETAQDDCAFSHPVKYHHGGFSFQDCLAYGYRVGVVASGDNHDSLPGLRQATDIWRKGKMAQRSGLVAVYAAENTREAIFNALWDRRCYATTGQRIILDFKVNGAVMGQEIPVDDLCAERRISVSAIGEDVVSKIEVFKNGKVLCSSRGEGTAASLDYVDGTPISSVDYYYAKVTQADGARAWSSPVWVVLSDGKE